MNKLTEWIIIALTIAGAAGSVYLSMDQRIDDLTTRVTVMEAQHRAELRQQRQAERQR